ncbi:MAG: hypothetical protein DWQ36_04745 [Acidobacteria bacterium]|nr:MAG: hypothetical protein DWQ30_20605 [Acidobacteriota bacterium]REK10104.1 MAG: hypothetical protein DWQ36_04745 [Acidobacteriota bacterium]
MIQGGAFEMLGQGAASVRPAVARSCASLASVADVGSFEHRDHGGCRGPVLTQARRRFGFAGFA